MKILYISQYFPPEMGAPSARALELATHWAHAGHEVSVLTGFPNHPTGVVPREWQSRLRHLTYREQINGVNVFRTWLWPLPNRKAHERMRNYASFCISAALRGLAIPRPDVVIASSPQLLVGLSGWWIAFSRQLPLVFEVRDLWPESLAAVGVGNENSLLHHALGAIAKFLYEHSNRIVVVSPAFKDHLIRRWRVREDKIAVVENGVETDLFVPAPPGANDALRQELGAEGKFLVCYIGTMGMAHGLETLLDAAAQFQLQDSNAHFLLVGEGAEKERIKAISQIPRAHQHHLPRPTASRENPCLHRCVRRMPGSVEEDRRLQNRNPNQDAGVYVLRPSCDPRCGRSGAANRRRRGSRNCN